MSNKIILQPPARQLINGIRSIGYNFSTALSDIIDNSVTANAVNIDIFFDPIHKNPYLCILDDGIGMNRLELQNAMTFGTDRDSRPDSFTDLGRFGLGLKTASLSQCKELIVVSKKFGKLNGISYDVDEINKNNKWEAKVFSESEIALLPEIQRLNNYKSGTIVIWRKFDKIEAATNKFESSFRKIIEEAIKHTALVFHKFFNDVNIKFNSTKVPERDPFLLKAQGRTQKGREIKVGRVGEKIIVTPYSLPYLKTLSNEEKSLLGDPKSVHDEQGFYIYRNNRLIIWGTWLKLGFRSELNKLARVKVDIPSTLDLEWSLDVKKSTARIPDYIKEEIRIAVEDSIYRSTRVYRHKGLKEHSQKFPIWIRTFDNKTRTVSYSINKENNTIISKLMESLDTTQTILLEEVLKQIESHLPRHQLQIDQIDELNFLNSSENEDLDKLEEKLIGLVKFFPEPTRLNILDKLLSEEAFLPLQENRILLKEKIK
jgi:hypothetical protein